jgi:hypothetical protein
MSKKWALDAWPICLILICTGFYYCWGLVLKYYELKTRQHKMLNINALRPLKHYLTKNLMNFGRRPRVEYHEGYTFVIKLTK